MSFLQAPTTSGGLVWDSGNAAGFVALAFFVYLFIETGRGHRQRTHQLLSYSAVTALVIHILVLWVPDATIWTYFSYAAPNYMWAGLIATGCLTLIVVSSLPGSRRFWNKNYAAFKLIHVWLSAALVALSLWHMIGSGFYLSTIEGGLLVTMAIVIWFGQRRALWAKPSQSYAATWAVWLLPLAMVAIKFVIQGEWL